jgi:predicted Zn-dependent protease
MNAKTFAAVPLVIFVVLSLNCAPRAQFVPRDTKNLKGTGKVYFAPLGDFPASETEKLVSYYQTKYDLAIETLPHIPLDPKLTNSERSQLIAERVIEWIKSKHAALVNNPQAILIGLTTEDMYITRYDWQFSFGWRQEGRYAVISKARMSLGEPSAEQAHSRLRKMVTKNIGIMYFKLQQSDDPRSVLYKDIGGIAELDAMGEEF